VAEKPDDVFSRLLKERIVYVGTAIDDTVGSLVSAQLLQLQGEDPTKDIHFYVNSPGGAITASFAIYDTMALVKNDIATYVIGRAAGTALLLVAAGTKGKRFALPHARLEFVEIWGGNAETDPDALRRARKAIFDAFVEHTGQSFQAIERAQQVGRVYGPWEGVTFGLVDKVIPKNELK